MNTTTVTKNEHGLVRVFRANSQLAMDIGHSGDYDRLHRALGVEALNAADIQQLQTGELATMSIIEFLRAGYEVRPEDIAENKAALEALDNDECLLLIMRSGAFMSRPVTLKTDGEAELIATLREPDANVTFEPLPDPDPQSVLEDAPQKKRPSDAAMGGRVATIALIVMALLVVVMIWVAG